MERKLTAILSVDVKGSRLPNVALHRIAARLRLGMKLKGPVRGAGGELLRWVAAKGVRFLGREK